MNANRLFTQLVDLTAIRDIELLEFSILRTIHQNLNPLSLRIFRLDGKNMIRSEIIYGGDTSTVVDKYSNLSDEIRKLVVHIKQTELNEYTVETESGYLTLYRIHQTSYTTLFLQVLNHDRISRENRHLLLGLLEIFRNYIDLLAENITDPLTGLLNRKSFDREIEKIYDIVPSDTERYIDDKRATEKAKYWLTMIDIDHFKKVNDKFGHLYGDDVLILLAQIINDCFRDDDLFFRFGGEEFVLLTSCVDEKGVKEALQRLLKAVSSYDFPQVGTVTISGGTTAIDGHTFSATLLDQADQALYYSKNNGRNQINFFEDLIGKGMIKTQEIETGDVDIF